MALIDHDGIDFVDTTYAAKRGWTFVNGGGSAGVTAGVGRGSSRAIVVTTANGTDASAQKTFATSYATMTWIVGVYVATLPGSGYFHYIDFLEGSTVHLRLRINSAGAVNVYRGPSSTLLSSTGFTLTTATYQVWQFSFTIHDSTGSWSFSVDGTAIASGSSVDTRNGGSGVVSACQFIADGPGTFRIDDVSVFDAVVTHIDYRNEALMPTGDGSRVDWTRSTGSTNYGLIDEIPASLTDFLQSATVGDKCSMTYPAPSVSGDIAVLTWRPLLRSAVAGIRQVRAFIRSGGTDYAHGTTLTVGSDDAYYAWQWSVHPVTTVAFVGGDFPLEVGLEVIA